jgi:hypothetical protein
MSSKYQNFKSGFFSPLIPSRYKGSFPIIYRSSLELKFFRWCDSSSSPVIEWTSESYIVPYQSPLDGKIHKYFIDNSITLKDKNGVEHKFLVEIKPLRMTKPPTESKKKSTATLLYEKTNWIKNQSKWRSAEQFAAKKGMKFIILTEEDLIKLN